MRFGELFAVTTAGDRILLLFLLVVSSFSIFWINGLTAAGHSAEIVGAAGTRFDRLLSESGEFAVPGPLGVTRIRIEKGALQVVHSDCPAKVCERQGQISRVGQVIVCVPNRVVVSIQGGQSNKFDAITE